jgi:hypothetical protein
MLSAVSRSHKGHLVSPEVSKNSQWAVDRNQASSLWPLWQQRRYRITTGSLVKIAILR